MDFITHLIDLIISFFKNSTVKKEQEFAIAEAQKTVAIDEIQTASLQQEVKQQQVTVEAIQTAKNEYIKNQKGETKKTLNQQLDDTFGSDN